MALIGEMQYLTIGGNTYSIPTSRGSTVSIERALTSGTKSATISVDGTSYDLYAPTPNAGTVTSVRVQATSPVQSSTSTAQSSTLNTTISLANGYGDTKNPYGTKTANYVLAGPSSGSAAVPSFRQLTAADIPDLSDTYLTSSDITDKADKFVVHIGDQISGDYYQIDKTYQQIGSAAFTGSQLVAIDMDVTYPYLGVATMGGALVIGFGFSATYNGTAILNGYVILENDTAMRINSNTTIPTKVSQLTNDRGFITSYTETDPTVPSWAKESTKPTYTASEVGALSGNTGGVFYGTCSTAAGTVAKVVECDDFTSDNLKAGAIIIVAFTATNKGAVASLTMNVNSTGAKPIKYINNGVLGNLTSAGYLRANTEYPFYYDGANWVVWFNYNTTYSALSEADMQAGTSTTNRLITAQRLKQAVQYHAPVTSVNGSTGDVTVTVPTKTSELTNDSGFLTTAPVTSVNGQTGAVTINVPTATSELTNDSDYLVASMLDDYLGPKFFATDATSQAVLAQMGAGTQEIRTPKQLMAFGLLSLLTYLNPRIFFGWMNGTELELAKLGMSVDTTTSTLTFYLRGRTSIATGRVSLVDGTGDTSWTVTPLASDAEGVAY